jgi:Domain of unknown function (DUF4398)
MFKSTTRFSFLVKAACVAGFAGFVMAGCAASNDMTTRAFAESEASARAAETADAAGNPRAALHLQLAKEHIAKANAFMKEKEYDLANRSLKRAKADADLALALAASDHAQKEADGAQKKVNALKDNAVAN